MGYGNAGFVDSTKGPLEFKNPKISQNSNDKTLI